MPLIANLCSLWAIILFFETTSATINVFEDIVDTIPDPPAVSQALIHNSASQTLHLLPPQSSRPVGSSTRTEIEPTLSSTSAPVDQSTVTTTQSSGLDDSTNILSQSNRSPITSRSSPQSRQDPGSSQSSQPSGTIHFSSTFSQGPGQTASSPGATNSSLEATSLSPRPSSNYGAGNTSSSSHREATVIGISVTTCVLITACVAYLCVQRRSRSAHNPGLDGVIVRPFGLSTPFTANSRKLSNQVCGCQPASIRAAMKLTWFRTHGSPVAHDPAIAESDTDLEHLADTKEALAAIDTTALPNLSSSMPTDDDPSENRTEHLEQQIQSLQHFIQLAGEMVVNGSALGNIENEHSSNLSRDSSDTPSDPPPAYTSSRE